MTGLPMQRDWEGLVARVVQLHEHLGAICMYTVYHAGKAGDHIHICCTQLTRLRTAGQFIHTADLRVTGRRLLSRAPHNNA